MNTDELRSELAGLAAALRAHLEWQRATGASALPRRAPSDGDVEERARAAPERATEAPPAKAPAPREPVAAADPVPPPSDPLPSATPARAPRVSDEDLKRLTVLAGEVAGCTKCGLSATRTQTVFSRGNPSAPLCFVGEAPGAEEDERGLPFVGRAGQLLDRMIAAMGLRPESDVYVCNILKCRPPGNRRPEPEEVAACFPYLHEQLSLVAPRVIVALGGTSVAALTGTKLGITKVRGQWKLYRGQTLVMPTYHPSYLLRPGPLQVEAKRQAWDDLKLVMKELGLPLPTGKK